jgi:hypothetical protein
MINCCANPNCSTRHCKSPCVRTSCANGPTGLEFFWLCPSCASHYDLALSSGRQVHLLPRPEIGRMSLVQLPQTEYPAHTTF